VGFFIRTLFDFLRKIQTRTYYHQPRNEHHQECTFFR